MSQLPSESLSYQTVVSEYFLALRGAGLMLSPLDLDQVQAWERRGLPVAVVCRGLRRGIEEARERLQGAPAPRALRAYRLTVEDEWRAYRSGRVGDAPPPPPEARRVAQRLSTARDLLAQRGASGPEPLRPLYQAAGRALSGLAAKDLSELERIFATVDAALLRGWLASLSRSSRAALGPRCRLRAGARPPATRPAAYREALRCYVLEVAREAGLQCLRGSV